MAQIRIEEKKKGSILPWIIGLLLLALVIWVVAETFDEAEEEIYTEETVEENEEVVAPVANDVDYATPIAAYLAATEDMEGEMSLDHEFSHRALTQLTTATVALAESKGLTDESDARAKADRVKQLADEITRDPMADDHGDKIGMAAMLITEMLETVDRESYGNQSSDAIQQLRTNAQDISSKTLALDQKEDIRSFFAQARTVLQRMS